MLDDPLGILLLEVLHCYFFSFQEKRKKENRELMPGVYIRQL